METVKKSAVFAIALSIPILAISVFFWSGGPPKAEAFPGPVTQCVTCHSFFQTSPAPHAPHPALGCTQCHAVPGDVPLTSRCGVCHAVPAIAQTHAAAGVTVCTGCHAVPTTETVCNDGIDNDDDGATDCADADCAASPACAPGVEICNDGLDNDNNGLIDCADPACASFPRCIPTETNCSDGIDNDGDGAIDCADSDCAANPVCAPPSGPPADHTDIVKGIHHKPGKETPTISSCTTCHGMDLKGGAVGVSCFACHGQVWAQGGRVPVSHTKREGGAKHKPGLERPFQNRCTDCHGANLRGSSFAPSCYKCHGAKWEERSGREGQGGRGSNDGRRDKDDRGEKDGRSGSGDRN